MISLSTQLLGPFGWPKLKDTQLPLPSKSGVYLMTVEHKDGYLPFGAAQCPGLSDFADGVDTMQWLNSF